MVEVASDYFRADRLRSIVARRRVSDTAGIGGAQGERMFGRPAIAMAAAIMMAGAASADPIEGDWRTEAGPTAAIAACGSSFCITLKTGSYAGRQIGTFKPDGGGYSGRISDPASDRTYSGGAKLGGDRLEMQGCVSGGPVCLSQGWSRL